MFFFRNTKHGPEYERNRSIYKSDHIDPVLCINTLYTNWRGSIDGSQSRFTKLKIKRSL